MKPDVQKAVSDLLSVGLKACGCAWLAVCENDSARPITYPAPDHRTVKHYLQTARQSLATDATDPVSLDPEGAFALLSAEQTKPAVLATNSLKAVNLFDSAGRHQGLLIGMDSSTREISDEQKNALLRIARLSGQFLETSADQNQSQQELDHSFSIHRAILNTLNDAVVMTDLAGNIQSVNPALERLFGYPEHKLLGQPITLLMPPEIAHHHSGYMQAYADGQTPGRIMGNLRAVQGLRSDGTRFTLQIAVTETTVNSERLLVAALQDITETEQAKLNLKRFRKTLDSTLDCVFMFEALSLQFFYVNQGAVNQLGYTREELLNMHPYDVKPGFPERQFRELIAPLVNLEVRQLNFQTIHRRKDGHDIPVDILLQYVTLEGDPPRFIAIVRDISEQKRHQEEIEHLAFFDPLTNLPNRSLIRTRLENSLRDSSASGCFGAVMLTDLDDFKSVNDTLGHRDGDELLVEISGRFADVVGDRDSICRLGGDEFLVVINTPHKDQEAAFQAVTQTAQKLLRAATQPTATLGTARPISTSIGIVLFNNGSTSSSELMRMADIAMYDAKSKGKNHFSLFDDVMQLQMLEEHHLTADLNDALSRQGEVVPWFQPKVNQHGQFTGFEALARWYHPERGLLNPVSFIDLAEKKNLIVPLSDQILLQSCQYMQAWRRQFPQKDWSVSVNICQKQLAMRDFPEKIEQILTQTGLPAHALMLEVTESVVAENIEESIQQMEQLRAIGVRFSLDDFGTGYSSLSYLRQLPIDELKIDKSFVDTLLKDPESHSIVKVILLLADTLNVAVIAEGIEEKDQWERLTALGCTGFQGYLFSRPKPPEIILEVLTQQIF